MSYSFDFTAKNAEDAKARVVTEMENVVRTQPAHAKDKDAAVTTAHAFIDMLGEDDTHYIRVNVHGAVGYQWTEANPYGADPDTYFSQASIGVSAWHVPKPT